MKYKFTYPITNPDSFVAYQQVGVGRELNDDEIGLLHLAVDLINDAYETGVNGLELFPATMEDVASIFSEIGKPERVKDPVSQRFFGALLIWENKAYQAGVENVTATSENFRLKEGTTS